MAHFRHWLSVVERKRFLYGLDLLRCEMEIKSANIGLEVSVLLALRR